MIYHNWITQFLQLVICNLLMLTRVLEGENLAMGAVE